MNQEECLVIANALREATSKSWASETPLVEEVADLLADKIAEHVEGFDRQGFLAQAKGTAARQGFWMVSWKEPNGKGDQRLVMRATANQALVWLLELKPYLNAYLGDIKVKPYRALGRKGPGFTGFL